MAKHLERNKKAGKENKKKISKKGIISNIFLIAFFIIFVYCSINLVIWIKSNKELGNIENELFKQVQVISNDDGKLEGIDFETLKNVNSDVVGWIYIKDTNINYPIMQTTDNEYYLKADINKKYSSCGSIFLDYDASSDFSDEYTIIYGHNLLNGKMFANLQEIYDGSLGQNVEITIYTANNEMLSYQVFSAYKIKASAEITKKGNYKDLKEKTEVQFQYDTDNINNKILTLITCDSTGKKRIIVSALQIK